MNDLNKQPTQMLEEALHQHSINQCVQELLNCIGSDESYPWKLDSKGNALWIHPIDTGILTRYGVTLSEVRDRIESHSGEHYRVLGIREHTQPCITTVH